MTAEAVLWQKEELTMLMSEKNMLGNALAKVAGPLRDFAEKLGGEEGELWLAAFKRFLRKEAPWPEFPFWKTIKLGTGLKTAGDFRRALCYGGFQVNDWASDILRRSAFEATNKEIEIDLVKVTVAELGFEKGARGKQIYERAQELGLPLCSSEIGPELRLQYKDQPNGEWVFVAMEPTTVPVPDVLPGIFSVGCNSSGLWLIGVWGGPDIFWGADKQWVFCRPRPRK